jgi:choline-sulfatase
MGVKVCDDHDPLAAPNAGRKSTLGLRDAGLVALALAAAFAALGCGRNRTPARARPPNVVIVLLDAVRADHLPVYDYPRDTAPFLATLAARGTVFDRAYSSSGWTSPATASLFTSLHPFQHGVISYIRPIRENRFRVSRVPDEPETIAEALRKAGYATFGVSDNPSASDIGGFDAGFDRFSSSPDKSATVVNRKVEEWRAEITSGRPYFLYLHYMDAHEPYLPQGRAFDEFVKDGRPNPRRDFVAAYDSEIRLLDSKVQGLFESLGWERDTIVIVTSDHGEGFHDHGLAGHANSLYDELMRVPLIVYGPGVRAGRIALPVAHVDVLPTLREITGMPPDPRNVGWSLAPLLREGRWDRGERPLLAHLVEFDEKHEVRAVVLGRHKLVERRPGGAALFDVEADPGETRDLAARHPEIVAGLREAYDRTEATATRYGRTGGESQLTPEAIEKLRALGYVK